MKDFLAIRMKRCHEVTYINILLDGSAGVVHVLREKLTCWGVSRSIFVCFPFEGNTNQESLKT